MSIKMKFTNHLKVRAKYLLSLLIVTIFLLGILTSSYIPTLISNLYTPKINYQIAQVKVSPSPSPSPSPSAPSSTPTPKKVSNNTNKNNSERAYKVAAYFVTHLDESNKVKIKQTYGNENMSDTELIRTIATRLDSDPALLAQSEAEVQKLLLQNTQQNVQYSSPDVNDNSECQLKLAKYSACMSEYNAEVSEYSACLSEKLTNQYKFCYKPINLCGFKPYCF